MTERSPTEETPAGADASAPRHRRRILAALGLLVLALVLLSAVALYTPLGLRLVERVVQSRLGDVSYGALSGTLAGPIQVVDLRVPGTDIEWVVDTIEVRWSPAALLRRRVSVDSLRVRGVQGLRQLAQEGRAPAPSDPPDGEAGPTTPPWPVYVRTIDVQRIDLPADSTLTIDALRVDDLAVGDAARWSALNVSWDEGTADLSGEVGLADGLTFDLRGGVDAVVRGETMRARAEAQGDLDRVSVDIVAESPLVGTIEGEIRDPQTRPDVDLSVTLDETDHETLVRLLQLEENPVPGSVRLAARVRGAADSLDVDGEAWLALRDYGPMRASAVARVTDSTATLSSFWVERDDARIEGQASVARREVPTGELSARWTSLSWPLDEPGMTSDEGRVTARGHPDDFEVEVDGAWRHPSGLDGGVRLEGKGSRTGFAAERFTVDLLQGIVTGRFEADWASTPRWDVAFEARDIDTRALVADTVTFGGELSGSGTSWGRLLDERLDLTVALDTVVGTVGIADVEASTYTSASIPRGPEGLAVDRSRARFEWFEAVWGPNRVLLSGRVSDSLDAHLTVRAPSLSSVSEGAAGDVDALVRLRGSRRSPGIDVVGVGIGLQWDSLTIDTIEVSGELGAASGEVADGTVRIRSAALGDRVADSIVVRFSGTRTDHTAQVGIGSVPGWMRLGAYGSFDEVGWSAILTDGTVSAAAIGEWVLEDPVPVTLARDSARIETGCWASAGASACLSAARSLIGARFTASVDDLPMQSLLGGRVEGWTWEGVASSRVEATIDSTGVLETSARFDADAGHVVVPGGRRFEYPPASAVFLSDSSSARATLDARLSGPAGLQVAEVAARWSTTRAIRVGDDWGALPLEASLVGHVDLPAAVAADLPVEVDSIQGTARFDLMASGSLDAPRVEGFAEWSEGSFSLPSLATRVTAVEVRADGRGGDALEVNGTFRMGGEAEVSGRIPLGGENSGVTTLRLVGEDLVVSDRAGFEVVGGVEVQAVATPDSVIMTGAVTVDDAVVEVDELDPAVVRPSADVVLVDDTVAVSTRDVRLDLRVTLGDSVRFDGFGLTGRPSGTIAVRGSPDALLGSGEVTLADGTYRAYGQQLDVERGRLLFAGSTVLDPGLDIRASRTAADGVVAGVEVAGSLRAPVLTVFSDPALPEIEMLSYIMVGVPWSQATSTESTRITDAAAAEGLRRGNAVANRIAPRIGLSDLRVQADGPLEEASLVAGRQFSSRLYVSYGVGWGQPISSFRIRYLLSQRWTLLAESGAATGADLLFRIERGR